MTKKQAFKKPVEDVPRLASLLEANLEAQGIATKVVEINYHPDYLEFQLEVARGVTISSLEALSKDIALFLASPTGKIKLVAPIPSTHRIGINLPRRSEANKQKYPYEEPIQVLARDKTVMFYLRNFMADIIFFATYFFNQLANKLHQLEREIKPSTSSPVDNKTKK